ncbi:type I toxin-antitoxin system Fst family toxin [Staphylococcus caeli]
MGCIITYFSYWLNKRDK